MIRIEVRTSLLGILELEFDPNSNTFIHTPRRRVYPTYDFHGTSDMNTYFIMNIVMCDAIKFRIGSTVLYKMHKIVYRG